jgi:flagellar FliL protein
VALGKFTITRYNPASNRALSIDFELHGTVLAEDVSDFEQEFQRNEARIREQVIMTVRAAEVSDMTDAGLGLMKRRILEKTNRAVGRHLLREVLFSNFNFVER